MKISRLDRRTVLRTGLLAGASIVGAGAALLTAAPAFAATQVGWRWCSKCQGLFFQPNGGGLCPAGGGHDGSSSSRYALRYYSAPISSDMVQPEWRWCSRCQGLAWGGSGPGFCPGSGRHIHSESFNYHLWHDITSDFSQPNWRWCYKCQAIFYGPNQSSSWCAQSGRHDGSASSNYLMFFG